MKPFTALILDGEQRAALAATRSLGKKGVQVIVGSETSSSLAGSSRYATNQIRYHSPFSSSQAFIQDLKGVIDAHGIGFLLPITDITMYHVLKASQDLSPAILPYASFDTYIAASDKMGLIKTAMDLDMPVPETIFVHDPLNVENIFPELTYPVVLKPRASLMEHEGSIIKTGVKIVRDVNELRKAIKDNIAFSYPFMIQEMIRGEGIGIFTLFHKGEPMAVFSHRRIREKPPWGGVSAVSESTEPDPVARAYALRLLEGLKWEGPAMVEFKRDERQGTPMLMEINARFWGSLQLAIDAGVDFPYLLYLHAAGGMYELAMHHKPARLRWLLGDLDNLYITLKSSRDRLPLEYHNKSKVIWNFIKEFAGPARLEVLRRDDLGPFLWEFKKYLVDILRR